MIVADTLVFYLVTTAFGVCAFTELPNSKDNRASQQKWFYTTIIYGHINGSVFVYVCGVIKIQ